MPNTNTLRSSLENAREDFSDFEKRFRLLHPDATGDIGAYILKCQGDEVEGTPEYQSWDILWSECHKLELLNSRLSTQLVNSTRKRTTHALI